MLCTDSRLAEAPRLSLDKENSGTLSPESLQPSEIPVEHFSISSLVQPSEQRFSSIHPGVTAISVRSSSEFLRLDSNRFPLQDDE
jgi:hypothetical protein